ncbi:hypothetical protein ABZ588_33615, partial [Streptomyces althioticus]
MPTRVRNPCKRLVIPDPVTRAVDPVAISGPAATAPARPPPRPPGRHRVRPAATASARPPPRPLGRHRVRS